MQQACYSCCMFFIPQTRTLRLQESNWLAQEHRAEGQRQDLSGTFLIPSGVVATSPARCEGPRIHTREDQPQDPASTWEVGHVGEGASARIGGIREERRATQLHGCPRVWGAEHKLEGAGDGLVQDGLVAATQFRNNVTEHLTLHGGPCLAGHRLHVVLFYPSRV